MTAGTALETTLRRDRLWVLGALIGITLLAWLYLVEMALGMEAGAVMELKPWTGQYAAMMFAMWVIMMAGMMLPAAAPVMLLHARVCRRRAGRVAPTGWFLLGYVVTWMLYSAGATGLQWLLERYALLSPTMAGTSALFSGVVLVAAGAYQLTPYKHACLTHCRSPMDFLARRWRDGAHGALRMGIEHGAFCVGCCWILMIVLFAVGVMDLLWVAALALLVFVEKVVPFGQGIARVAGTGLIAGGLALIAGG